jgi:hypothetical protein
MASFKMIPFGRRIASSLHWQGRTGRRESRRVRLREDAGARVPKRQGAACTVQGCRKRKHSLSFPKVTMGQACAKASNWKGFPLQAAVPVQGQCYAVRHGSSGRPAELEGGAVTAGAGCPAGCRRAPDRTTAGQFEAWVCRPSISEKHRKKISLFPLMPA